MKRPKVILVKRISFKSHTSNLAEYSPEDIWDYGQTSYSCSLTGTHFLLILKQHPEYQHNFLLSVILLTLVRKILSLLVFPHHQIFSKLDFHSSAVLLCEEGVSE